MLWLTCIDRIAGLPTAFLPLPKICFAHRRIQLARGTFVKPNHPDNSTLQGNLLLPWIRKHVNNSCNLCSLLLLLLAFSFLGRNCSFQRHLMELEHWKKNHHSLVKNSLFDFSGRWMGSGSIFRKDYFI